MIKWLQLLLITVLLCFFTQGSQDMQELAALAVLGLGTSWIISGIKKPISH